MEERNGEIQCQDSAPLTLDTQLNMSQYNDTAFIGPSLERFFSLEITQCKLNSKYTLLTRSRRGFKKQQQQNSYLMSSTDQIQIMTIKKFTDHISTKSERDPTIIFTPTLHIFVWVRPQQVTEQTFER